MTFTCNEVFLQCCICTFTYIENLLLTGASGELLLLASQPLPQLQLLQPLFTYSKKLWAYHFTELVSRQLANLSARPLTGQKVFTISSRLGFFVERYRRQTPDWSL